MDNKKEEKLLPLRVFVRLKPDRNDIEYTTNTIGIVNSRNQRMEYSFDRVFPPHSKTYEIYEAILPELQKEPRRGVTRHISVLAYGQTGSGKTHTMLGTPTCLGIVPLVFKELSSYSAIKASFLEIYNEKTLDLLSTCEKDMEKPLRERNGAVFVQGLTEKVITTQEEFNLLASRAFNMRKTASTAQNKQSSRSHLIIWLQTSKISLSLVDLAGTENNKQTGNSGLRMNESSNINRSLFVLNKVINAIISGESRVPYRDSKLTRLLSASIGGVGSCFLIATLIDNFSTFCDAMHTLRFASNAKKLKNSADIPKSALKDEKWIEKENNMASPSSSTVTRNRASSSYDSIITNQIEMTPITKKKSYECFIAKAKAYEENEEFREALSTYRMLKKFASSEFVDRRIAELQHVLRRSRERFSKLRMLEILNSMDFIGIKRLSGVGNKRAKMIVDFVQGGNLFESLSDLKMLFSDKVISRILENLKETEHDKLR